MTKIERKTQKIFAGNADTDELAVFGSMISGTPVYNDDIEALQSEAYTEGWKAAVAANEAPFMEEMNAVQYGFSKQLAYLFQQGIPEWDAGTTYYLNSFCQVGGVIYKSKLDENINHSPGDDTEEIYWTPFKAGDSGSGGIEVCDIGMSLYIDETKGLRRWLNGQIVAINQNTQGFLTRLKKIVALYPSLLTTEENWQAAKTLSDYGQVGKFVFNYAEDEETVESVRLPAVVNVQGLLDLQNLGMTVQAGLPNITGTTNQRVSGNTDDFTTEWIGAIKTDFITGTGKGLVENDWTARRLTSRISLDASHLNPTYGAADTVQEEAIQYPYFIQVATGAETENNIINDIELNNPFFFGMSQYFDVEPNNLSWLKSDGVYKPKSVYPDYYNWILENVNKGVEGFKGQEGYCFIATDSSSYYWWVSTESPVVGASVYRYDAGVNSMFFDGTVEILTSNGFTFTSIFEGSSYTVTRDSSKDTSILHPAAWITDNDFEINTSDETFKLPLLDGSECLVSDRYIDLTLQASGTKYTAVANGFVFFEKLNTSNTQSVKGTNLSSGYADVSYGTYSGSAPSILLKVKRGDIFSIGYDAAGVTNSFRFIYARGNGSLYYYVGETVQNANLIDAGRIVENYATKQYATGAGFPSDYVEDVSGQIQVGTGILPVNNIAPADGFIFFYVDVVPANVSLFLNVYTSDATATEENKLIFSWIAQNNYVKNKTVGLVPISKGQKYALVASASSYGNVIWCQFVYAKGAIS